MTHRVALPSPRGSLFKAPRTLKPTLKRLRRAPQDAEHLEAIRQCPCVVCLHDPAGEAAHVRWGSNAGMGRKPEAKWCLPVCHPHHMEQHSVGELSFWEAVGIAPRDLAAKLWRLSPNVEAMRALVFVAKVIGGKP